MAFQIEQVLVTPKGKLVEAESHGSTERTVEASTTNAERTGLCWSLRQKVFQVTAGGEILP